MFLIRIDDLLLNWEAQRLVVCTIGPADMRPKYNFFVREVSGGSFFIF